MTVIDAPAPPSAGPPEAAPAFVTPARPAAPERVAKSLTSDVLATVGLVLFSAVVAAGFARVFTGWDFFDGLLVLVLVGHGTGLVTRRVGMPPWASIPLVSVAVIWTLGLIYYGSTYSWGLPTSETWNLFSAEIDLVREQFHVAVAPVVDGGGWDVLAAIGLALAVVLADAFAFGAMARAEALVPGGVLFVFVAALGDERLRVAISALLVGAGVVATVLLRAHHAPGGITDVTRGAPRVVTQALVIATAIALIAGAAGSRVPGATSEPLLDTRGGGDSDRSALSPLVDIRSRLTNQRDLEMIVVTATEESYWRATTLAEFDGRIWRTPERDLEAPPATAERTDPTIRQQVRIVGLAGSYVPAAPDAIAASGSVPLRYDHASSSASSANDDLTPGDVFEFTSAPPRFSPESLTAATSFDPGDAMYFELPDDFPEEAAALASEITADATSTYEAALALQNWFKAEFTYSLQVQPGHGNSAIRGFLRDRVGYCEQFAGTYAAMMRSLGIPARVAIGFTSGRSIGGNSYSVAGRNAHAWPEVWFDELGWVLFEPTPGRGAPGTEVYTGVAPAQEDGPASGDADAGEPGESDVPVGTAATSATTTIPRLPDSEQDLTGTDGAAVPTDAAPPSDSSSPWVPLGILALAGAAIAAPAVVRRVRRRPGRSPADQLANNWERAIDALRLVHVPIVASETPAQTADSAVRLFPIVSRPIHSLAEMVTFVTYSPDGADGLDDVGAYGNSKLRDSAHWARQVERSVTDSLSRSVRVRRYFTTWR